MIIKVLLSIGILCSLFLNIKSAYWAQNVAAKYMAAHYETTRCNKFISARDSNSAICPIDERACDEVEDMWIDYEISRKKYHKIFGWFRIGVLGL